MHQTIVPRDAVGRDIAVMHQVLQGNGHSAFIFGEHVAGVPAATVVTRETAETMVRDSQVTVIYHHSIYWAAGEQVLSLTRGPIAIKYHNVTPPNYFADSPNLWVACAAGREQTYRFATRFPRALWLPDSKFNLSELGLDKVLPHVVVPPFIGVAQNVPAINEELLTELIADPRLQLLFVSRLAPNKGHLFLIDVLASYVDRFGTDVILTSVGAATPECQGYYDSIAAKIAYYGLKAQVRYVGSVPEGDLLSYYLGSDAYVCCSEHEGFCVPVIEAQWLCLPIVARAAGGAVAETIGRNQAILGEDPAEYATTVHRIRTDGEYRRSLISAGHRNFLSRFTQAAIETQFLFALSEMSLSMTASI
jgi:glycosyltransferase involved in cell wall biosynthesis